MSIALQKFPTKKGVWQGEKRMEGTILSTLGSPSVDLSTKPSTHSESEDSYSIITETKGIRQGLEL